MKKLVIAAGLALAAFTLMADFALLAPAFAQDAASTVAPAAPAIAPVLVPYGDWIGQTLAWLKEFGALGLSALIAFACRKLPAQVGDLIKAFLTDQVLKRGVDYMFAAMEGATRGDVFTLPQTNAAIAFVERYFVTNAPILFKWVGDTLRPKIVARLSAEGVIPAEASATSLKVLLPAPAA